MPKTPSEFIIIPSYKISCSQTKSIIHCSLDEDYLILLKSLVLSSSRKKIVFINSEGKNSSESKANYDSKVVIANFIYETSFVFFSQTKRPLLDINVTFESLNPDFLNCLRDDLDHEVLFIDEQKAEVERFIHLQRKNVSMKELSIDRKTVESSMDRRFNFDNTSQLKPQAQQRVALGGTFDHLHIGHKILLSQAAFVAKKSLVCGVMDPSTLSKKKFPELLESLETRIGNVESFLKLTKPDLPCEVVPIFDAFGPTITDPTIDTLVVSRETSTGGSAVNQKRIEKGYAPLEIISVEVISLSSSKSLDQMLEAKLSSSSIREQLSQELNC